MKAVNQTIIVGQIEDVPGNCLQAAVASLLDLPIEAVPHFLLFTDWHNAMKKFLYGLGYLYEGQKDYSGFNYYEGVNGHAIISGLSPRNVYHSVIYNLRGEMVHDPHPSRAGIVSPECYFKIEKLYQ